MAVAASCSALVILAVSAISREEYALDQTTIVAVSVVSVAISVVLLAATAGVSVYSAWKEHVKKKEMKKLAIRIDDFAKSCAAEG